MNHSNMQIFFIIINFENSCAAEYFCWNRDAFLQDSLNHLFEIKVFCNIINAFVTFDQFNATLLNKSVISSNK